MRELRDNNFDLLRLLLALIVLLAHSAALSGAPALEGVPRIANSDMAVKSFYVISGFLIFMSYDRANSLREYVEKRVRRLYPGYVGLILFCAAAGAWITAWPSVSYLNRRLFDYLWANFLFLNFLHPSLPGVFAHNPLVAVNGSLWTLRVELCFYAVVPALVWLIRRYRWPAAALLYALSLAYSYILNAYAARTGNDFFLVLERQLPGALRYFISGAALYHYLGWYRRHATKLLWLGLTGLLIDARLGADTVTAIGLAIVVLYGALVLPTLGNAGSWGDLSYGVYIYHFPVVQTLVHYRLFDSHPWLAMTAAIVVTLALSLLSWHAIEKHFLKRSSHYVLAAS